jgi:hypothetical protein
MVFQLSQSKRAHFLAELYMDLSQTVPSCFALLLKTLDGLADRPCLFLPPGMSREGMLKTDGTGGNSIALCIRHNRESREAGWYLSLYSHNTLFARLSTCPSAMIEAERQRESLEAHERSPGSPRVTVDWQGAYPTGLSILAKAGGNQYPTGPISRPISVPSCRPLKGACS